MTERRSKAVLAMAIVSVFVLSASAQAIVIDRFQEGSAVTANSGDTPNDQAQDDSSAVGGERDLRVAWEAGRQVLADVDFQNNNEFEYITAPSSSGKASLEYDGDDDDASEGGFNRGGLPTGERNFAPNNQTAFRFDIVFLDRPLDLDVTVWSPDGSSGGFHESTATLNLSEDIDSLESHTLAFSEFDSSIDFTNISALRVSFDAIAGTDFTMSQIITAPAPAALPAGLALMGLLGFARSRRLRRAS